MLTFRWLAAGAPPAAFDLRRLGWRLVADPPAADGRDGSALLHPVLAMPTGLALSRWVALTAAPAAQRGMTAMLGIDDGLQRARLLNMGFGEALGWNISLDELAARTVRMGDRARLVARQRQIGALLLDLVRRDGLVAGRALGLHPREFALLWRLADEPGRAVSAALLLRDVWQLRFRPETNSLAVHVSRLRAKLRLAGLDGLIETGPEGGYRLAVDPGSRRFAVARPDAAGQLPLDAYTRMGKERVCEQT